MPVTTAKWSQSSLSPSLDCGHLRRGLLVAILLLLPFSDSPLQATPLQIFGASPAAPLIVLLFLLSLCRSGTYTVLRSHVPFLLALFSYLIAVSMYGYSLSDSFLRGESSFVKGLKLILIYGSFVYLGLSVGKVIQSRDFRRVLQYAYLIALLGLAVDPYGDWSWAHHAANLNQRPRGFAAEASHLAPMVFCLAMLATWAAGHGWLRITYLVAGALAIVAVGSKGAILSAVLAIPVLAVIAALRRPRSESGLLARAVGLGTVMAAVGIGLGAAKDLPAVSRSTQERVHVEMAVHTSIPTRLVMLGATLEAIAEYPFGVGPFGWTTIFDKSLSDAAEDVAEHFGGELNLSEVDLLIQSPTSQNLGTKTFMTDIAIMFGVPFLLLFHIFSAVVVSSLIRQRTWPLAVALAFAWISLSTYVSGPPVYVLAVVYGVAISVSQAMPSRRV